MMDGWMDGLDLNELDPVSWHRCIFSLTTASKNSAIRSIFGQAFLLYAWLGSRAAPTIQ
jgi:hypothetical protein